MNNIVEESPLPCLENLQLPYPGETKERDRWSPIVWHLDSHYTIYKLERVTISGNGTGPITTERAVCEPKTSSDILDFILDGGTCYLPCSKKFLGVFSNSFSYKDKVALARGEDVSSSEYTIRLIGGCFLIRKGNRWGRVFSFWESFPQSAMGGIKEQDPEPMSLEDFFKLFVLVVSELSKEGFSIAILHSAASLVTSYLLSCKSREMFGHLSEVPFEVLEDAHQSYKGSRFEGHRNSYSIGDYWDIKSAYPSKIASLIPCSSKYMNWYFVEDIPKENLSHILLEEAFYSFILCNVTPTEKYKFSPSTVRYATPFGYRLAGVLGAQVEWLTLPEYKSLTLNELAEVVPLEGSIGIPIGDPPRRLEGPMRKLFRLRNHPVIGRPLKSASQTVAGKMGSTWIEEVLALTPDMKGLELKLVTKTSPLFNLVYAAHVNGALRAEIMLYALKYNAEFIRADGIKVKTGTSVSEVGETMGALALKASGAQSNPDDILWEGPEGTQLLNAIISRKGDGKSYTLPKVIIRTLKGELLRGKTLQDIGKVEYLIETKSLGSKKRVPLNIPSKDNFKSGGIIHRPPKGRLELQFIRQNGVGDYDYC